jgi:glycosyltransferase involved in cell wall biosynthesis
MVAPRVQRNDWGVLAPPPIGEWRPTRTVSVIVPAYNCQDFVDLALAALTRQTYPSGRFEVVVVDDGSEPKIELPALAPPQCRVVRVSDYSTGWGRANALHVGTMASDGEIIHWLDADLVPFPEHVEAQARWHHLTPDAVTLGYKRFVPHGPWPTPRQVRQRALPALFPAERTEPHDYIEEFIEATDLLRTADHLAFRAHVGATAALRRELYRDAGGMRTDLRLGEDSELGYRLAQVGAVFIPEPAARSWHLGPSHMMRDGDRLRRYNRPYLADLMPQPRWMRGGPAGRTWRVPLVTAVVRADGPLEVVRACVDRLLAGDQHDLVVRLVADWDALTDERQAVLADPLLDRRLLAATYRGDPRVSLVDRMPESAFPSPYLLVVPAHLGVGTRTVGRLVEEADRHRVGLLRLVSPGTGTGTEPPVIDLWRTAALSRAQRCCRPGESLAGGVTGVWGGRWVNDGRLGVVDLSEQALDTEQPPAAPGPGRQGGPAPVPVAGLRSLLRATAFVGRLAVERAWQRLRPGDRQLDPPARSGP